jgi:hypothetical protein
VAYDRIAGYFRSSLFEVAGEAINKVQGPVRIICNSDLDPQDLVTAAAAQAALRRSWCAGKPEEAPPRRCRAIGRCTRPDLRKDGGAGAAGFGVRLGPRQGGVCAERTGTATAFLGSVNESASAWKLNYELLWEDDSAGDRGLGAGRVRRTVERPRAMDLSVCPFIAQDVQRIITRRVIEPQEWKATQNPTAAAAAAAVETPVYRREQGLWPHQKYFARWRWSAIGWVARAWCWPTRWGWERRSNWPWRHC